MSALRGKKLDPEGKKTGVQTGRSQNCGKQSDRMPVKQPKKKV
jgi:hypothetical protein